MSLLGNIREAWGWRGLKPQTIVAQNDFGNLIVKDADGRYWRLSPDNLSCDVIADDEQNYMRLCKSSEFIDDWEMQELVREAKKHIGSLPDGMTYCLKIPAALGGDYASGNIAAISVEELVQFSGDLAEQIKDLADGLKVELRIVE